MKGESSICRIIMYGIKKVIKYIGFVDCIWMVDFFYICMYR